MVTINKMKSKDTFNKERKERIEREKTESKGRNLLTQNKNDNVSQTK